MQQELLVSPLVADPAHLGRAAVVGATETWTWQQVHEASIVLARRIRGASAVCNLCSSRLAFLITLLATLRNGSLMVLPPSGSDADIAAVLNAQPDTIVVGDARAGRRPGVRRRAPAGRSTSLAGPSGSLARPAPASSPGSPRGTRSPSCCTRRAPPATRSRSRRRCCHLATGALLLGARLAKEIEGGLGGVDHLVCSVPAQHMFGLECSVMLPLVHGTPVLDRRPLLPADVAAAFDEVRARRLDRDADALAQPGPVGRGLARVRVRHRLDDAARPRARPAEPSSCSPRRCWRSTDRRKPAPWRCAAPRARRAGRRWTACSLDPVEGATLGRGAHFASPVQLLDEIVVEANGSFTLLGRQADLIKIAGRRASLAGLNLLLQDLPGLGDGVFYLPATGNPTERLCLIYSGPPLERAAIRRWLRARLDPVFLPRDFIRLERMPRSETGKLRLHSLDLAYSNWQAAARPQRGKRSAAARERAVA